MSIDVRFLNPPATCALCGRRVDPDGAPVIAATDEPHVASSISGAHMLIDVTLGESLVICRECDPG